MNFEQTLQYLEQKPEAEVCFPFDAKVPTLKIYNKMFALLSPAKEAAENTPAKKSSTKSVRPEAAFLNLKCDPDHSVELRDIFDGILPGYHMNKKHWISVLLDGSVPSGEIQRLIDVSYSIVVQGLKKSERDFLELRYSPEELYAK